MSPKQGYYTIERKNGDHVETLCHDQYGAEVWVLGALPLPVVPLGLDCSPELGDEDAVIVFPAHDVDSDIATAETRLQRVKDASCVPSPGPHGWKSMTLGLGNDTHGYVYHLYPKYVILSLKWSRGPVLVWWQPKNSGYTPNLDDAGRYSAEEIAAKPDYYNNGESTLAILEHVALKQVRNVVLLDNVRELLQRQVWVDDDGIHLTKPEPQPCEVCEDVDCSADRHSIEEQEQAWQNRNQR